MMLSQYVRVNGQACILIHNVDSAMPHALSLDNRIDLLIEIKNLVRIFRDGPSEWVLHDGPSLAVGHKVLSSLPSINLILSCRFAVSQF